MLFKFKPKSIHLDCFTYREDVYSYSPIVKGTKKFPEWWKNLEHSHFDFDNMKLHNTMRSCVGFIDFFRSSVSIPLWCDLAIKTEAQDIGSVFWQFSDSETNAGPHEAFQYGEYADNTVQHLKIETPWQFRTKDEVKWVWSGNPWNQNLLNKVIVLPAVVEYKYQHATAIQAMISRQEQRQDILIKHGTPIVNLFPMSESNVEIHNHLVSLEEYNRLHNKSKPLTFSKKYSYIKNLEKANKCPIHFWKK